MRGDPRRDPQEHPSLGLQDRDCHHHSHRLCPRMHPMLKIGSLRQGGEKPHDSNCKTSSVFLQSSGLSHQKNPASLTQGGDAARGGTFHLEIGQAQMQPTPSNHRKPWAEQHRVLHGRHNPTSSPPPAGFGEGAFHRVFWGWGRPWSWGPEGVEVAAAQLPGPSGSHKTSSGLG